MQIKDDPSLKWPKKMKGDPNKRNKNKYCRFHRDHGHDTDKCFDLKQQIENLIRQGKLRHFVGRNHKDEKLKAKMEESSWPPLGEIKVIIGGTSTGQTSKSKKTYLKVVQNVQLSGRSLKTRRIDEPTISFTDEEAERIHHPHDDAIVITLLIVDYTTRRVLVDNGSSANILYYPAFQQMRLGRDLLRPACSLLIGFGGMHRYAACSGGVIPTANNQVSQFPRGGLFVLVQYYYWKVNSKQLEGSNIYLPSISQISYGVWDKTSTRRLVSSKRMLLSHDGFRRAGADDEYRRKKVCEIGRASCRERV